MKNPETREMMAALYRLVEKYETIPDDKIGTDTETLIEYFTPIVADCEAFARMYPNSILASELIHAFYCAASQSYKEAQEKFLRDHEKNA